MSALADEVMAGDRRALAQAITLVESDRLDHRATARELVDAVLPSTGAGMRIAVSGSPGAGKSTLIEALGLRAIESGHRVAVLAVDPSSRRSHGSILGDKTRMTELGRREQAYIRPSPSGGALGGVARRTREAILLCEAAGFDLLVVETVGVGQSEVAVADLVDIFLLVASPTGGDELQGIKRGIVELADVVAVNKADGDLRPAAEKAAADLRQALHLLRTKREGWEVPVLLCSAVAGDGVTEVWDQLVALHDRIRESSELGTLRAEQAKTWLWNEVSETLVEQARHHPRVQGRLRDLEAFVAAGEMSPAAAAQAILDELGARGAEHG